MRGSITPRGNLTWRLTVSHGHTLDGQRRRTTRTVRGTRTDAEAALARLLVQVDEGQHTAATGTVRWLGERWWELASPDWTANTRSVNRSALDRHIYPAIGNIPLRRLRPADLDGLYTRMRRNKLGPSTIRRVHDVARRMLNQAVRWGDLGVNPAFNASPPPTPKGTVKVPARDQVQKVLVAAAELDACFATYLRVLITTGCRRAEACALTWPDIDFDTGLVSIDKALPAFGPLAPKPTKTGRARRVRIDPGTIAALSAHRDVMGGRAGQVRRPRGPYVFSNHPAGLEPWHPDSVTHRFATVAGRAGAPGIHLHSLRHFNATQLLAAGTDVRTVAGRLGHSQASTTLNVYAAFVPAADAAAAETIGNILDS